MKLVFVYWAYEDQGSGCDLACYAQAARAQGHEVRIYGPPNPRIALEFSRSLEGADALVFVFEWTTALEHGDALDWVRLLQAVPRERRVVIDCDGMYNAPLQVGGDYNHRDGEASRRWTAVCDALSDRIYQPTLHPARANVRPFLFHVYDPDWERPLDFRAKAFSMIYLGHSKFRWAPMCRVLRALEPIRGQLGRVGIVGHGWDRMPHWAAPMGIEDQYRTEPRYLEELGVEVLPPVPFAQVIDTMSQAVFNPIVYRPLFEHLGLVTCRTFETIAAGTLPLFVLEREYVREIFGERAVALILEGERPHEQILDLIHRPDFYADIVRTIRADFAQKHSPAARLRQLLQIVEDRPGPAPGAKGARPCA